MNREIEGRPSDAELLDSMRLYEIGGPERDSLCDAWRACYDTSKRDGFYVVHESDLLELLRAYLRSEATPDPLSSLQDVSGGGGIETEGAPQAAQQGGR